MRRVFRVVLGVALIGYGVFSGNAWFFLGVIPLFFGIINVCPVEKLFGAKCDGGSCSCSSGVKEEPVVAKWSTQKKEGSCCQTPSDSGSKCCGDSQNEAKSESCCENADCIKIEVLGTGCQKCKTLEAMVKEAVLPYGDKFCVTKVEDTQKIISYGVMSTPALVIDGKVVLSGRVPSKDEIAAFLN